MTDIYTETLQLLKDNGYSDEESLKYLMEEVKLFPIETVRNGLIMKNKERILNTHSQKISYQKDKDIWYTYVYGADKRRIKLYGKTKTLLEDAVIDFYKRSQRKEKITLRNIFEEWLTYKQETCHIAPKTVQLLRGDWKSYYEDARISDMDIKKITPNIVKRFFREVTSKKLYDAKRISSLRSLISGIMEYAVEEEIIPHNPVRDVSTKDLPKKQKQNKAENVYSEEEKEKLLGYLNDKNGIYELAIALFFCLTCRIGELKALRWTDIDFKNKEVYIHTQIIENGADAVLERSEVIKEISNAKRKYSHVNYVKKHSDTGTRVLPLNDRAIKIIQRIKELDIDKEYLFMKNNCFLITTTFNEHLQKVCLDCNIRYLPSHQIRFTNACFLYQNSQNLGMVQESLGHSSSAMTLHYLSRNTGKDKMKEMFDKL